jgi:glycosyltransferase involved in cell wall biosynthesis
MRIGVDVSCLTGGRGLARYTQEVVKSLVSSSCEADRFFLYSPFNVFVDCDSEKISRKWVPVQKWPPWLNWTLPKAVKEDGVDVMFFPANDCWLWHPLPTVVVLHDVAPCTLLYDSLPSFKDKLQIRLQMKRIGMVADRIVTVSEFSVRQIEATIPSAGKKVTVVYNGVNSFARDADQRNSGRDRPYILFVGGFDHRKNIERLMEAYRLLLDRGRKEKLVLVGAGGANRKLYYDMPFLIKSKGLAGFVDVKSDINDVELARYYSNAEFLILPSIVEGFGLPVVEAMSCGCAVCCSNAASIPEVAGEAGVYFDPFSIEDMVSAMLKILTDRTMKMKKIEIGYVQCKKFDWSITGQSIYKLLQGVVKRGRERIR